MGAGLISSDLMMTVGAVTLGVSLRRSKASSSVKRAVRYLIESNENSQTLFVRIAFRCRCGRSLLARKVRRALVRCKRKLSVCQSEFQENEQDLAPQKADQPPSAGVVVLRRQNYRVVEADGMEERVTD